MTKGEAIIRGMDQIREGLEMIRKSHGETDVIRALVGSQKASQQLRSIMGPGVLQSVVVEMVVARNRRLIPETVKKIVDDFVDVLFELSQPFESEVEEESPVERDECLDVSDGTL